VIRLRTSRAALFGAMLAIMLIVFMPLRAALGWLALDEQGLSVRRVSGTIWGGTLRDAAYGDLSLGDLRTALAPLPLILGRARLGVEGPSARGSLLVSRHLVGVDRFSAALATGRLFAPLPVTAMDLDGLAVRFRDGRCEAASGRVRATLAGGVAGVTLPPSIAGDARCDAGALLLPLASQAGTESVALRIQGAGRYMADLSIRPADPLAGQRLEQLGFQARGNGYRLSVSGSF
jgi:general secretion pathway protein N